MTDEVKDLDAISLDELRKLANEESQLARDEQGRFVSAKQDEPVKEAAQVEDEPVIFRREIDLGDGSGKQVFTADSLEGLVDQLAEAQRNATKKIRELNQTVKTVEPEKLTLEDRLKRAEEKLAAVDREQQANAAAIEFVQANPEYLANERNGKRMFKWLKMEGLEVTVGNLEKAFTDLSESGLLEAKSDAHVDSESKARIEPEVSSQRKRVSSGLSARAASTASRAASANEPNEDELYSMPLDKLRDLAMRNPNKQAASNARDYEG